MMKKAVLLGLVLLMGNAIFPQKMMTRQGVTKFEASVPAFEAVAAVNNSCSAILDVSTGEFAALVLVKSFKFKVPLMEEHFNENYMESSQYPKATFKGQIKNFDLSKVNASSDYELEGELSIHGVQKRIKTRISISGNANKLQLTSHLILRAQDFNIKIPSVVKSKIAEEVNVSSSFDLTKS